MTIPPLCTCHLPPWSSKEMAPTLIWLFSHRSFVIVGPKFCFQLAIDVLSKKKEEAIDALDVLV